ncbi:uncharacterized protein [Miscanthus floridulus]|uniref:uncharacterized protein isoform X2 n=1 Tax=Miscanthus floridulus TaxID=154761 RepID=UPI00345A8976
MINRYSFCSTQFDILLQSVDHERGPWLASTKVGYSRIPPITADSQELTPITASGTEIYLSRFSSDKSKHHRSCEAFRLVVHLSQLCFFMTCSCLSF